MEFYLELIVFAGIACALGLFNYVFSLMTINDYNNELKKVTLKKLKPFFILLILMHRKKLFLKKNRKSCNSITFIEFIWFSTVYLYYIAFFLIEFVIFLITQNGLLNLNLLLFIILIGMPIFFPLIVSLYSFYLKKIGKTEPPKEE